MVLRKGIIIVSIAGKNPLPFLLREHMGMVNEIIIYTLKGFDINNLQTEGYPM